MVGVLVIKKINMFLSWPREFATPQRIVVKTKEEFLKLLNRNIKRADCYTTIYSFEEIGGKRARYSTAIVDKVFFDFDSETCLENVKRLSRHLSKEDILHTVIFSGRGFHLYIFTKPENHDSSLLFYVQQYYTNKLKLDCDTQCFGDIARITRIPNTFNFKRNRFCIPITHNELFNSTYEEIRELAKKQRKISTEAVGSKLLDIKSFRKYSEQIKKELVPLDLSKIGGLTLPELNIEVPPLIKKILIKHKEKWNKKVGYWDRYIIILTLRELGIGIKEAVGLLKEYLTPNELRHCLQQERQIFRLYERKNGNQTLFLPKSNWLRNRGFELTKEDVEFFDNFYVGV